MKKLKKIISTLLIAGVFITAVGCGSKESDTESVSGTNDSSELKTIRIASPTADATALVENAGIALNYGYIDEELEKAGYKAEYIGFGQGGTAINEAFASGEIDVAFVGDVPLIIGKSNGLSIEVFASLNSEASMGIIVAPNSEIKDVKDLNGKKICAAFGTVTYIYLYKLLDANGLEIDDVEIINDIANGATLLASGDVDAVVSTGSGVQQMEGYGVGTILTTSDDDTTLSSQFFAAGDSDYLEANPDAAKAIIRALKKAQESTIENPEATYSILETDDVKASTFAKIYPEENGFEKFEPYLADSTKDKFNATVKVLYDSKVITNEIAADDLYDNTYTKAVYEELGQKIPQ